MNAEDEANARARMENEKACELCVFGEQLTSLDAPDQEPLIECRRYPPAPVEDTFTWPIMNRHDWCGEFVADHRI